MTELLIPKPQPNFPHEDVDEVNAQIFRQLLLEPEYMFSAHALAEEQVEAFRIGHSTLKSLGYVLYKTDQQQRSFSFGATVYEILSTTVRPPEQSPDSAARVGQVTKKLFALKDDSTSVIMNILDEEEAFTEEMPRATELVGFAAELNPNFDKRLILWGAALERGIERDITDIAA